MSKIKIYELAKELDKPSKELVEFLNKKDVEAKTHMSTIDEAEADMVRKAFAPKANAEKAEEETAPPRRSEPLRYKVGGPSEVYASSGAAVFCAGMNPPCGRTSDGNAGTRIDA